MAKFVFTDAVLFVNSVDLSDHVESVTLNYEAEVPEDTSMGDATKTRLPGLLDWSMDVVFRQDFAASKVDVTMFSLVGAAAFPVKLKATSAATSATNPDFQGNALLASYSPIGGTIGDVAAAPISLMGDDTLSRVTS